MIEADIDQAGRAGGVRRAPGLEEIVAATERRRAEGKRGSMIRSLPIYRAAIALCLR